MHHQHLAVQTRLMSFDGNVRCLAEWRFENGGSVAVLVGGDVPTEMAIEWIELLLERKKQELAQLKEKKSSGPGFKAAHPGEGDPSAMPDCPGPETTQADCVPNDHEN